MEFHSGGRTEGWAPNYRCELMQPDQWVIACITGGNGVQESGQMNGELLELQGTSCF